MQLKRQRQFSLKVVLGLRRSSRKTRFFSHQRDSTWLHALKWLTVHVAGVTAACGQLENCCISQLMALPSHHAAAVYVSWTDGRVLYCGRLRLKSHSVSKRSQRNHERSFLVSFSILFLMIRQKAWVKSLCGQQRVWIDWFISVSEYDQIWDPKSLLQLWLLCVSLWAGLQPTGLVWSHLNFPEGKRHSCCAPVWQCPS